ncbi:putative protein kinase, partial [Trypanosoma conorhini]
MHLQKKTRNTSVTETLRWWDRARAVEQSALAEEPPLCRSSQAERLKGECVARVARGDSAPFARRPRPASGEPDDVAPSDAVSSATGKGTVSSDTTSLRGSFRGDVAVAAPGSEMASLEAAAGCLPRHFTDHLGGVWKRALSPVEEGAADVTPVYMGISATGTLAVLKV